MSERTWSWKWKLGIVFIWFQTQERENEWPALRKCMRQQTNSSNWISFCLFLALPVNQIAVCFVCVIHRATKAAFSLKTNKQSFRQSANKLNPQRWKWMIGAGNQFSVSNWFGFTAEGEEIESSQLIYF